MGIFSIANEEQVFEIEWPEDFCGPEHLANVANRSREVYGDSFSCAISEKGLTTLLQLAYRASLSPEEGQHLRFRLFISNNIVYLNTVTIISFDEPVAIDGVDILRKLAPATTIHNFALAITEVDNVIYCTGILPLSLVEQHMRYIIGLPQLTPGVKGGPAELVIRVDGPGEIRTTHMYPTFRLRGGQIQALFSYSDHPYIKSWFNEVVDYLINENGSEPAPQFKRHSLYNIFSDIFSRILGLVLSNRHGGALIVLPSDVYESDLFQDIVIPRYQTSKLDIASLVDAFFVSSSEYQNGKRQSVMDPTMIKWSEARRSLLELAEAIANLANIDGCVVLDRETRVKGFGGRITTERGRKPCFESDLCEDKIKQEIDITSFGTRHGSAFNICSRYPGTLAFVISQDGDLRVFYGSEHHVLMWEASAWMSGRDHW